MKEYTNPWSLIADTKLCAVLDILTEDEQDYLRSALDYESIVLRVHDGVVDVVDTINGDVYNTLSVKEYVHDSIYWAMDMEK